MADRLVGKTVDNRGKTCELYEPEGQNVEVFVDGIQGLEARGPNIKFNFYRAVPNHLPENERDENLERRVIASRVVMGVDTFLSVVDWLNNTAAEVRGQLVVTEQAPSRNQ